MLSEGALRRALKKVIISVGSLHARVFAVSALFAMPWSIATVTCLLRPTMRMLSASLTFPLVRHEVAN
jgi:hypothetical protein